MEYTEEQVAAAAAAGMSVEAYVAEQAAPAEETPVVEEVAPETETEIAA